MKISIIGSGAMGSLYGGKLSKTENDVLLFDINSEHVERINQAGLDIEELSTGTHKIYHPTASTDPGDAADSDIMIIFVKSSDTQRAAFQFKDYAGSETIVVTLQNGLGNEEIIRNIFGASRTAAGVTSQGSTFLGPGKIRHAGSGPTHLCMSDKQNEKLKAFVDVLNMAGFETHIEKNIESLIWSKLIINVGINALTALTGLPNGQLLDFEDTKAIISDLIDEALWIVKAKGITLNFDKPLDTVYEVARKTAQNRSSMLQDFDKKKTSEIDFINGAILKEADALDINVPVNRTIIRLVKILEACRS